eukprot:scaffold38548_cov53-Phaeocystis_antarctica.AAC.3
MRSAAVCCMRSAAVCSTKGLLLPAASSAEHSLGAARGAHTAWRGANREMHRGSALLCGEGAKPATRATAREASSMSWRTPSPRAQSRTRAP